MIDHLTLWIAGAIFVAYMAGALGPRWRGRSGKKPFRAAATPFRPRPKAKSPAPVPAPAGVDSADQLRVVMGAQFEKRRLLSKEEARVFYRAENAVQALGLGWRVMAQVSLGEILKSPDPRAYGAINSKRVDVLLIAANGDPIAAIEYQGSGHYLGSAAARDAVKREALRRAGIRYLEVMPDHGQDDMTREVRRIAGLAQPAAAA